jgi:hypothetical protein
LSSCFRIDGGSQPRHCGERCVERRLRGQEDLLSITANGEPAPPILDIASILFEADAAIRPLEYVDAAARRIVIYGPQDKVRMRHVTLSQSL